MKITIDLEEKILIGATDLRFVKNSENVFPAYIYGVPLGYTVKLSYTKPDNNLVGPIGSVRMNDPDGLPCYYSQIPEKALTIKGEIGVSIGVYSDPVWELSTLAFWMSRGIVEGDYDVVGINLEDLPVAPSEETAARVYISASNSYLYYGSITPCISLPKTTGYILDSDVIQVPKELETTVAEILAKGIRDLETWKETFIPLNQLAGSTIVMSDTEPVGAIEKVIWIDTSD